MVKSYDLRTRQGKSVVMSTPVVAEVGETQNREGSGDENPNGNQDGVVLAADAGGGALANPVTAPVNNITTSDAILQAQQRLVRLQQENAQRQAQQEELANLLQQCSALESANQQLSTTAPLPPPVLPNPSNLPPHHGPGSMVAAAGLVNLAQQQAPLAALPSTVPYSHLPANVNNATLRQMQGIQAGVDNLMRSNGLTVNDPGLSDSSDDDSDSGGRRCRRRKSRKHQSGKVKKMTSYVPYPQLWPHTKLSLHYVSQAKKYEELSLAEFTAGYVTIIQQETVGAVRESRLAHLKQLMYYATTSTWASVLNFHAAFLMEIERGNMKWGDSTHELTFTTLVPKSHGQRGGGTGSNGGGKDGDSNNNKAGGQNNSVSFCKAYQKGSCTHTSDHNGLLFGRTRFLRHICANCWQEKKTFAAHPDTSPDCPCNA